MKYSERSCRRSLRYPKSKAGPASNRCRTVIRIIARYPDGVLSHAGQKGGMGLIYAFFENST
ncbi:hypothetical protein TR13x_05210 [Caloranaerobacter sp. TR13]|nr:hypothetical protein TR13x_05210 [Caloranaerobacter sp. TR13]